LSPPFVASKNGFVAGTVYDVELAGIATSMRSILPSSVVSR
jgi:hypothetical protein